MLVTPGVLPSGRALAGRWVLCCTHLFLYGRLLLVPCWLLAALSLAAIPQVVVRDLPTPVRPVTPPTVSPDVVEFHHSPSSMPSLEDLLLEEEHEVSVRRRRACRKRAHDSAAKTRRRSIRLTAKEDPFYVDATAKATCVKDAIASSGVLHRPTPAKISLSKLRCRAVRAACRTFLTPTVMRPLWPVVLLVLVRVLCLSY